ncbi:hypothetical protein V6N11_048384 [Hibiscus sabdariffa]|uniref:Uncharacterized protein n=1 Tax=Hibiscus sabdariffa TaxID=183260 RepID=A0ABR2PVK9_9ROSI
MKIPSQSSCLACCSVNSPATPIFDSRKIHSFAFVFPSKSGGKMPSLSRDAERSDNKGRGSSRCGDRSSVLVAGTPEA